MANTTLTPEVRAELLAHLTQACIVWTEDIMRQFFGDSHDPANQQLLIEAYAEAIASVGRKTPNQHALLSTFVLELQDRIHKD